MVRWTAWLCGMLGCAWAQPAPPSTREAVQVPAGLQALDPFPVVGTRLASGLPTGAIVLDRQEIDRLGVTRLEDVLSRLPQNYGGAGSGFGTVPNGSPGYGLASALFNFSGATASPPQTGVAAAGLGGLGAGNTLVLVDGRRLPLATQGNTAGETRSGFYDLAAIPLALIERIEVLPLGASAVHGADAVGGVVNLVLKRGAGGGEISGGVRGTFRGGGFERHAAFSYGLSRGPLELRLGTTVFSRESLRAAQRGFSARQDLTPFGGFDYRLSIGSPAAATAAAGNLVALASPGGPPVRIALVRPGAAGAIPTLADFEPTTASGVTNLRRYNTAAAKDLVGLLEQGGGNLAVSYRLGAHAEAFLRALWSDRRSVTAIEPPVTLGGGFGGINSRLAAASRFNPFGQDVIVSLVHVEAPLRRQTVRADNLLAAAGLRGTVRDRWRWEAAVSHGRERFDSRTLELRQARFVAALADGRFNPFADPSVRPVNAGVYPDLMTDAVVEGESLLTGFDFNFGGSPARLPGGEVQLAAGADWARATRRRESSEPRFGQDAASRSARTSHGVFAELSAPLAGVANARTGLRALALHAAARHESAGAYRETSPRVGFVWSPFPALEIHGSYAAGFRAPALSEFENTLVSGTATVRDPLHGGASYPVRGIRGSNPAMQAERSQSWRWAAEIRPSAVPGLTFRGTLAETYVRDWITALPEQSFVTFESLFPGRVRRDARGIITEIDATSVNFGKVYSRSLGLHAAYGREVGPGHRFTFRADAVRQLESRTEFTPGAAPRTIADGADTASPPRWSADASLWWTRGNAEAGLLARTTSGFAANSSGAFLDQATRVAPWSTIDVRAGYRFDRGVWRGVGKGLSLRLGVGNVADRDPPFANLVWGYNAGLHSPLGRTYDLSVRLPF